MLGFWAFFWIATVFGGLASVCYFMAVRRLIKKGAHVKFLATPKDLVRVFREYADLARSNAWSLWPVYGYCLFAMSALCAGAAAAVYLNASQLSSENILSRLPRSDAALLWVAFSSLCIAVAFSYRAIKIRGGMRVRRWKDCFSNEYLRNDVALAALGLSGLLIVAVALILRHF